MCSPKSKLCKNLDCQICFEKSFASHEKSKYWSNKNILTPREVFRSACKIKYWFDCDICEHSFDALPTNITRKTVKGSWCPYCFKSALCDDINCKYCFEKSFASHEKAKYWSVNNPLSARQVTKRSGKNFLFNCENCFHEFVSNPDAMYTKITSGCSYCNGNILCDDMDCDFCFNKSFASHPRANDWSDKNEITPRQICYCSGEKYWIDCKKCKHSIYAKISDFSTRENLCPYCTGDKLCNDECNFCFEKSFASCEKSKYWNEKNTISPRQICRNSGIKFFFNCNVCHNEFFKTAKSINTGQWCPKCTYKTERKLYEFLQSLNRFEITRELKLESCRSKTTNRHYSFDFCLDNKIIIELDGPQHFRQISNWQSPKKALKRDIFKMDKATAEGYSVIRIFQEDVLNDEHKWQKRLLRYIDRIIEGTRCNIFFVKGSQSYSEMRNNYNLN